MIFNYEGTEQDANENLCEIFSAKLVGDKIQQTNSFYMHAGLINHHENGLWS